MDREKTVGLLNRVLHDTVNSVVQYIGSAATPHVPKECEGDLETIERLREEEAATAHEIHELVGRLDGVPAVGVFDYWNVDLNYLDLRFLARFAAGHVEKVITEIEGAIAGVRQDAEVHALLRRVLEQKRAHLGTLREIGAR
jgi:hypothetical protein